MDRESPSEDWIWSQEEDDGKGGWIYLESELRSQMVLFAYNGMDTECAIVFFNPKRRLDYLFSGDLQEAMSQAETQYWHHINND